jgi:D-alanyl-D-alanine carboxypeptidase
MLERFVKEARSVAADAQEEARACGSPTVEAEHVLLALARDPDGVVGDVLAQAGLDHARVLEALEAEFARSLHAVGVSVGAFAVSSAPSDAGRPRWGASAKASLERALGVARARGDRRIESSHILLGVLAAREGTVPRALRGASVEPAAMALLTEAAMDRG